MSIGILILVPRNYCLISQFYKNVFNNFIYTIALVVFITSEKFMRNIVVYGQPMERQNKPPPRLPPVLWAWPRRVSLKKGRVLIGQGVKGGGNRVIKWCVLIGSSYTCQRFDWFAPYLPIR